MMFINNGPIWSIIFLVDIYFSKGFSNNNKITTKEDIALFKSLLKFSEEELCSK